MRSNAPDFETRIRPHTLRHDSADAQSIDDYSPTANFQQAPSSTPRSRDSTIMKSLIVHRRDDAAKYELKDTLQNTLILPDPIRFGLMPVFGSEAVETLNPSRIVDFGFFDLAWK